MFYSLWVCLSKNLFYFKGQINIGLARNFFQQFWRKNCINHVSSYSIKVCFLKTIHPILISFWSDHKVFAIPFQLIGCYPQYPKSTCALRLMSLTRNVQFSFNLSWFWVKIDGGKLSYNCSCISYVSCYRWRVCATLIRFWRYCTVFIITFQLIGWYPQYPKSTSALW